MRTAASLNPLPALALCFGFPVLAATSTIVEDTWSDGTRSDTDLPGESAWHASSAASLAAASGTMTGTTSTSSRTWWTHFTTAPAGPVQLGTGETLKVSVGFIPTGINAGNTSRGFRAGLFDFSGGTRTTTDGNSPNGTNVAGYMLNLNFAPVFGVNHPLEIRERTNLPSSELMGTSGDYTALGSGGGSAGSAGLASGVEYTLEFSVTRTADGAVVTTSILGPDAWSVTHTATTAGDLDRFDTFAIRPANLAQTAASFTFTKFKAEVITAEPVAPEASVSPLSRTATVGQTVTFTATASGSSPLTYQWFHDEVEIEGATAATLNLTNVQLSDAGSYTVTVTNGVGSDTASAAVLAVEDPDLPPPSGDGPHFDLVGFAALDGFVGNGTFLPGGTTGGAGGARVQVSTLADLKTHLESTATVIIEVMNDIDLSSLDNHGGGNPADYPTGEIFLRSNKTLFSRHGATIRGGTLRIGKASLGPQQNIIIRNLKFRDLWVLDPGGSYDTYGWDYIHIEEGCHHIWIDHCDFEKVYDGMIDMTHAVDFVTVSWCVFRNQKKCHLIGHSDNNAAEDIGRLNVTFHHNHYVNVEERMPRMRFGNAHVFNLYSENLGGNGIQSTANAAVLVENSYFLHPGPGTRPTREENGGPLGVIKVNGSIIENLPGANVVFRERVTGGGFTFNPPFAGATPPYAYRLDPAEDVPQVVVQYAGVGKLGFVFWQQDHFTAAELADPYISGPDAIPAGDGVTNLVKYALGVPPRSRATAALPAFGSAGGQPFVTYRRPASATDVRYHAEITTDLLTWTQAGVSQQRVATGADGLETWEARYTGPPEASLFFRLSVER